jgi:hypothetical protein
MPEHGFVAILAARAGDEDRRGNGPFPRGNVSVPASVTPGAAAFAIDTASVS